MKQRRLETIEKTFGFKEFEIQTKLFMKSNNFSQSEIDSIFHLLNSYYFMGLKLDIDKEII